MTASQYMERPKIKVSAPVILDNGGRRRRADRRRYSPRSYFPERRALRFRRSEMDRRKNRALAVAPEERRLAFEAPLWIMRA
jgi:hypothetical protein